MIGQTEEGAAAIWIALCSCAQSVILITTQFPLLDRIRASFSHGHSP